MAGVGPGNPKYLTVEVKEAIEKSKNIVAFGRISNSLKDIRNDFIKIKRVAEVMEFINKNKDVLILASGDPCFYGIIEYLKKNNIFIEKIMPGISSFQYMMAKLGLSWQGANLMSLHGRNENLESIREHELSIILTDSENTPSRISNEIYKLGIRGKIYAGFNLSYEDEIIIKVNIGDKIEDISSLAVVVVENEMD